MNPKIVVMNLLRDINKFIFLNIIFFFFTLLVIVSVGGYDKREIIFMFSISAFFALGFNFLIAKIARKNVEKIIKHSFEKVENQLYFDELTSVYNRTTGINRLKEEIARSQRNKRSLSVAMLDIDNFKTINDKYGHIIGDKILNRVASQIKNHLRIGDIVSRYGGEEFLIILPETDEIKAYMALERVRAAIEKKLIRIGGEKLQVTVSIGLTEVDNLETPIEVLERADKALYQAKSNGKNRIEIDYKDTATVMLS